MSVFRILLKISLDILNVEIFIPVCLSLFTLCFYRSDRVNMSYMYFQKSPFKFLSMILLSIFIHLTLVLHCRHSQIEVVFISAYETVIENWCIVDITFRTMEIILKGRRLLKFTVLIYGLSMPNQQLKKNFREKILTRESTYC